ncbi:MAG: glucose-6-phosphate isomerase, partial [Verrucomicrobiota bacterium]|nr:glucose-6-phosphate isomerase [Verrucomicrobiota bacterium]
MTWERFSKYYLELRELNFALDISRINFSDNFLNDMQHRMKKAYREMANLEAGTIANPDENRMVGHYWLRNSSLAPTSELRLEIDSCLEKIKQITADIHNGVITGTSGNFKNFLIIGIGGSALGPQFVSDALGSPKQDKLSPYFFDNTDPDGIDRTLDLLDGQLGKT